MDPLMASAVRKVMEDKDYIKSLPRGKGNLLKGTKLFSWLKEALWLYIKNDPAILDQLIRRNEESLEKLEQKLLNLTGDEVFAYISEDRKELQARLFDPTIFGTVLVCQFVANWLNKNIKKWLGAKNVTKLLSKSVEHNVTSEMGLAICDLADVVRQYPEVCQYLTQARDDHNFFRRPGKIARGQGGRGSYQELPAKIWYALPRGNRHYQTPLLRKAHPAGPCDPEQCKTP